MFLELSRILLETMKSIQWYFEHLRFYPAWYERTNWSYNGDGYIQIKGSNKKNTKQTWGGREEKEMKTSEQTTRWSSADSNQLAELRGLSPLQFICYRLQSLTPLGYLQSIHEEVKSLKAHCRLMNHSNSTGKILVFNKEMRQI